MAAAVESDVDRVSKWSHRDVPLDAAAPAGPYLHGRLDHFSSWRVTAVLCEQVHQHRLGVLGRAPEGGGHVGGDVVPFDAGRQVVQSFDEVELRRSDPIGESAGVRDRQHATQYRARPAPGSGCASARPCRAIAAGRQPPDDALRRPDGPVRVDEPSPDALPPTPHPQQSVSPSPPRPRDRVGVDPIEERLTDPSRRVGHLREPVDVTTISGTARCRGGLKH